MGQMDSPLSKNQSSTGNDSFPATDGCGLITCLKLPATPVTTFYDTPKAPLPSANRLPYDPDFISRELPESIFRPPRLLTT
jgi:hypothetical protein